MTRPSDAELRMSAETGKTVYALRQEGLSPAPGKRTRRRPQIVRTEPRMTAHRRDDTLCVVMWIHPRPKKNSPETIYRTKNGVTRQYKVPPKSYQEFAADVERLFLEQRTRLGLPLPGVVYSLSVVFFIPAGYAADTDNLVVGLNDALQGAGVFVNDRMVRTISYADTVEVSDEPRVAFTLAPRGP